MAKAKNQQAQDPGPTPEPEADEPATDPMAATTAPDVASARKILSANPEKTQILTPAGYVVRDL